MGVKKRVLTYVVIPKIGPNFNSREKFFRVLTSSSKMRLFLTKFTVVKFRVFGPGRVFRAHQKCKDRDFRTFKNKQSLKRFKTLNPNFLCSQSD